MENVVPVVASNCARSKIVRGAVVAHPPSAGRGEAKIDVSDGGEEFAALGGGDVSASEAPRVIHGGVLLQASEVIAPPACEQWGSEEVGDDLVREGDPSAVGGGDQGVIQPQPLPGKDAGQILCAEGAACLQGVHGLRHSGSSAVDGNRSASPGYAELESDLARELAQQSRRKVQGSGQGTGDELCVASNARLKEVVHELPLRAWNSPRASERLQRHRQAEGALEQGPVPGVALLVERAEECASICGTERLLRKLPCLAERKCLKTQDAVDRMNHHRQTESCGANRDYPRAAVGSGGRIEIGDQIL